MAVGFGRSGLINGYQGFSTLHYIVSLIVVVAALTAGSAMLMWLGERITENRKAGSTGVPHRSSAPAKLGSGTRARYSERMVRRQ